MKKNSIIDNFDLVKYDEILSRGLCHGKGDRDGKMCIEAAICTVLDLPHGDDPGCVASAVRSFKIGLNDSNWSSDTARAAGLKKLGLAQLGSKDVVDNVEFSRRLSKKLIQKLIPKLFREIFPDNEQCLNAAAKCETEGTSAAARYAAAADAAAARYAADAARYAADAAAARYAARYAAAADAAVAAVAAARYAAAADAAAARYAADAARYAADAAAAGDEYLVFVADLALEVLVELKSPGCALLEKLTTK